jgi:hypothetical protein
MEGNNVKGGSALSARSKLSLGRRFPDGSDHRGVKITLQTTHAGGCMSTVPTEIADLEERLRLAELSRDVQFFKDVLSDDVIMVSMEGTAFGKQQIVDAHASLQDSKFTRVEMSEMNIVDHGNAAVVTCQGDYEGPNGDYTLQFMRLWLKKGDKWQIVGGSIATL